MSAGAKRNSAAGPLLGPVVGPIAGGLLGQHVGWRWIFWVLTIVVSEINDCSWKAPR